MEEKIGEVSALSTVALATGTKCLSANRMLSTGQAINDSHAEVTQLKPAIETAEHVKNLPQTPQTSP